MLLGLRASLWGLEGGTEIGGERRRYSHTRMNGGSGNKEVGVHFSLETMGPQVFEKLLQTSWGIYICLDICIQHQAMLVTWKVSTSCQKKQALTQCKYPGHLS